MFHEKLLSDSRSITNSLMTRNVRMVPKTPELNNMVSAMLYSVTNNNSMTNDTPLKERSAIFERELTTSSKGAGLGNAEMVEHLTPLLKSNLLITRSYALPLIQTITDFVENAVRDNDSRLFDKTGVTINSHYGTGIFGTELQSDGKSYESNDWGVIYKLVSEYANTTFNEPPQRPKVINGNMGSQEIADFIKTGITSFDESVATHYISNYPDRTESAFQAMFATPAEGEMQAIETNKETDLLYLIFGYLFCRGINRDTVPDNVTVGLDEFLQKMGTYKAYLGKTIHDKLEKIRRQHATGYMKLNELTTPEGNKVIEIDPSVLDELLGENYPDIKIETFIGCALSQTPEWFKDRFIDRAAEFNMTYARDRANRLETVLSSRRTVVRDAIVTKVSQVFTDGNTVNIEGLGGESITLSFEENKKVDLSGYVNTLVTAHADGIAGNGDIVNDAILKAVTDVVCKYLLDGTMVNELVTRMMSITNAVPDVDTNHAGMLSVISILVDYMMGQVEFQLDFSRKVANPGSQSYFL